MTAYAEALDAPHMNHAPAGAPGRDLPEGFLAFLEPLHRALTPWQQTLVEARARVLAAAHQGRLPDHRRPSEATAGAWRVSLPDWCADQRNQMTGPADDGELVVKMLNSGAPGVMVDLEDSMANTWENLMKGHRHAAEALHGDLTYFDAKRGRAVAIQPSPTGAPVILTRVRGLHLSQAGVFADGPVSASLFDLALHAFLVDPGRLKHPLCIYIPKSESAEEGLWWRQALRRVARARGWRDDAIKCMALVEAHPLAYQMEEFLFHLREHILGLNLGRWDYMASLIHFHLPQARWVLPDRNTIPHDVPFFQRLRERLPEICHRRGVLAIGGMTALYPSRVDAELNARALAVLEKDKRNEAQAGMDGAWTGHPDQNAIAVAQFPQPNQLGFRRPDLEAQPDLRPVPEGVGRRTIAGSRTAARVTILYRYGVLAGRGASLIEGYMEDLATDRIYRLMLAQRTAHAREAPVLNEDDDAPVVHTPELVTRLYDEELEALRDRDLDPVLLRRARRLSEQMVVNGWHDPR